MLVRNAQRLRAFAIGLASATPASAHPPHVEGWKPLASLALAAAGAAFTGHSYRRKTGSLFAAIGAGGGVFIVLSVLGLFVSFASSL